MTLIAVCSVKGSPGVTTAALGLAACWPVGEQPVVVEADPAGGDLLARFGLETSPGLVSLAAAGRRGAEPGLVWQHTQRLPGGLPVVVAPPGADQARAALTQLATAGASVLRRAADRAGTVVIADCGRVAADPAAAEVIGTADVTLLLARARSDALSHVASALATAPGWLREMGFLLVGDGPSSAEVADALQLAVLGRIPDDPKGAAALAGLPARRSAPARSALLRALEPIATAVARHSHMAHQGHSPQPQPQSDGGAGDRAHHGTSAPTPDGPWAQSGARW